MRASQKANKRTIRTSVRGRGFREIHISGAEGIFEEKDIAKIVGEYALRALSHQKGRPDNIVISVEELIQQPLSIESLSVTTAECVSVRQSRSMIRKLLGACGISERAIKTSFSVTEGPDTMRGAAMVLSRSGRRVEQDQERGIRASRLGIGKFADKILSRRLSRHGINTTTVREALILASKVAACQQIRAELCVSDDPNYTTGYVSSRKFGYIRIPHIKKKGEKKGGRVFFLEEDAAPGRVADFLEKTPVIIAGISPFLGIRTLNEIIDHINK